MKLVAGDVKSDLEPAFLEHQMKLLDAQPGSPRAIDKTHAATVPPPTVEKQEPDDGGDNDDIVEITPGDAQQDSVVFWHTKLTERGRKDKYQSELTRLVGQVRKMSAAALTRGSKHPVCEERVEAALQHLVEALHFNINRLEFRGSNPSAPWVMPPDAFRATLPQVPSKSQSTRDEAAFTTVTEFKAALPQAHRVFQSNVSARKKAGVQPPTVTETPLDGPAKTVARAWLPQDFLWIPPAQPDADAEWAIKQEPLDITVNDNGGAADASVTAAKPGEHPPTASNPAAKVKKGKKDQSALPTVAAEPAVSKGIKDKPKRRPIHAGKAPAQETAESPDKAARAEGTPTTRQPPASTVPPASEPGTDVGVTSNTQEKKKKATKKKKGESQLTTAAAPPPDVDMIDASAAKTNATHAAQTKQSSKKKSKKTQKKREDTEPEDVEMDDVQDASASVAPSVKAARKKSTTAASSGSATPSAALFQTQLPFRLPGALSEAWKIPLDGSDDNFGAGDLGRYSSNDEDTLDVVDPKTPPPKTSKRQRADTLSPTKSPTSAPPPRKSARIQPGAASGSTPSVPPSDPVVAVASTSRAKGKGKAKEVAPIDVPNAKTGKKKRTTTRVAPA
ncbi:hypothetical protein BV20DRAFT_1058510 [Pilatotrama ljubarskyi]|nr:hypothetical protein BV20DRAFT_1058510 [Pilatotrama ljubarskyi]